ncbi:MAG: arylformamidase [Candidatus Andeanibacterium colombiense]|uniref:Kynurenine formamidase n=1 Tax=Candidatus Andeanibacterium colombiense TaxID=3121345 RepID=A0AAJ5X7N6_9SPHN|nr:MAG: arylformamidase [Sphingomonadaceae bacterium]
MSRILDISQILRPTLPVWPGEPPFALERLARIGPGCPVNVSAMSTPLHAGSHADSPFHYADDGAGSGDCALDPYIGPCVVIDVTHAQGSVKPGDFDSAAIAGAERVILRTYETFPADAWDSDFTAIAPETIAFLAAAGVRLIGTDAPSLDPQESKTLDAHHQVLAADMRILEGLVLDGVAPGTYELIALPLKIAGADASPVRAILRELDK